MTTEIELPYDKRLSLNTIDQVPLFLDKTDILDESTDMKISLKMIDSKGEILLLLEAMPKCIDEDELNKNIQGCFIRRFLYVGQMLEFHFEDVLKKFLKNFITDVRSNLVPLPSSEFFTHYQYLWAMKEKGDECKIAALIGLPPIKSMTENLKEVLVYKDTLSK